MRAELAALQFLEPTAQWFNHWSSPLRKDVEREFHHPTARPDPPLPLLREAVPLDLPREPPAGIDLFATQLVLPLVLGRAAAATQLVVPPLAALRPRSSSSAREDGLRSSPLTPGSPIRARAPPLGSQSTTIEVDALLVPSDVTDVLSRSMADPQWIELRLPRPPSIAVVEAYHLRRVGATWFIHADDLDEKQQELLSALNEADAEELLRELEAAYEQTEVGEETRKRSRGGEEPTSESPGKRPRPALPADQEDQVVPEEEEEEVKIVFRARRRLPTDDSGAQ